MGRDGGENRARRPRTDRVADKEPLARAATPAVKCSGSQQIHKMPTIRFGLFEFFTTNAGLAAVAAMKL